MISAVHRLECRQVLARTDEEQELNQKSREEKSSLCLHFATPHPLTNKLDRKNVKLQQYRRLPTNLSINGPRPPSMAAQDSDAERAGQTS